MHRCSLRFDKYWHNLGQKMSGQFSSKQTLGFCRIIKWVLDKRFYFKAVSAIRATLRRKGRGVRG